MFAKISAIFPEIFRPSLLIIDSILRNSSFLISSFNFSRIAFWQMVFPPSKNAIPNWSILNISLRSVAFLSVSINNSATFDSAKNYWACLISFLTLSDSILVLFQFSIGYSLSPVWCLVINCRSISKKKILRSVGIYDGEFVLTSTKMRMYYWNEMKSIGNL